MGDSSSGKTRTPRCAKNRRRCWIGSSATVLLYAAGLLFANLLTAQNRCADCHAAQQLEMDQAHIEEWRDSAHARAGVGCEDCHGGDPTTFVQLQAHRGVLHSARKHAKTSYRKLPETCGSCHLELLNAWQNGPHSALVEVGSRAAPSCATCHGSLATQSIAGGGLQARCSQCHGEGAEHANPASMVRGGDLLLRLRDLTATRNKVGRLVLRIQDLALRHDVGHAYFLADREWEAALESGHALDYEAWEQALADAEPEFAALLAELER